MEKEELNERQKILIGSMLYFSEWMDDIRFHEEHFTGVYRKIYAEMLKLKDRKIVITSGMVIMKLMKDLPNIRTEIAACENARVHFRREYDELALDYLEDVLKRQCVKIGKNIGELYKENKDIEFLLSYAQTEIDKVFDYVYNHNKVMSGAELYSEFIERYLKAVNNKGENLFINSGIRSLDNIFKFRSGLYILAGRPAMGKTAVGLIIGKNIAKKGKNVLIRSLEMSSDELIMRYICSQLDTIEKKNKVRMYQYQGEDMLDLEEKLGLENIYIDDRCTSLNDIIADTRQMHKDGKCDMMIIDYLSLIQTQRGERRDLEVSDITTKLKLLSRELNIPILLLAQLNRLVEGRTDKKPILADLRESGGIEQDADVVMMIYRPKYYKEEYYKMENDDVVNTDDLGVIIVRKNRHGRTGEAYLKFNNDLTDACDWDFQGEPKPQRQTYDNNAEYEEDNLPF